MMELAPVGAPGKAGPGLGVRHRSGLAVDSDGAVAALGEVAS